MSRPLLTLALVCTLAGSAACQRPPRVERPAADQRAWTTNPWTERVVREAVPADLEGLEALAHAAGTVLDELEPALRDRILAPLWPYGPELPLEGPHPGPPPLASGAEGSPVAVTVAVTPAAYDVWRADDLVLRDVLALYARELGTPELAAAALFLGPDALARARRGLRRVPPEKLTTARVRPNLRNRTERAQLALADEALTRAMLFGLVWPVERTYRITSGFGPRWHPVRGVPSEHRGVDIATPEGTVIAAPIAGRVRRVAEDRVNGRWLELDHGRGVRSQYMHLAEISVKRGQQVAAGEPIALSGATGRVTGPHLHYQVKRDAVPVDPVGFRIPPERANRPLARVQPRMVEGSQTAMP